MQIELTEEEQAMLDEALAMLSAVEQRWIRPSEAADHRAALARLAVTVDIAEERGIDVDGVVEGIDLTTTSGLILADKLLAAAIASHKPMPHVTLKEEPAREVNPAIPGLTTVRGL